MKRRTEKERTEIIELKELVIKLMAKHHITPYEIGERVDNVTFPTVLNIYNGTTKVPNREKLEAIKSYIEVNYENKTNTIAETKAEYNEKITLENVMRSVGKLDKKIDKTLSELKDMVQENGLRQQLIFELLTNAKASEVKFLQDQIAEMLGK